ncbi:nuclear transport factor 2 family protein [Sciscionella marina]|uniref:nuclear transport factor 2 family protein n=1 Tax=Sciscionella marina TaxID=508770 RepID=UPI0003681413|nr:nuclear transport factor 2 family protein [Sciscionella marina]
MTHTATEANEELPGVDADRIREVIEEYLQLLGSEQLDRITELFTSDALVEDPAGSKPKSGSSEIRELYRVLHELGKSKVRRHSIRIGSAIAVVHFTITTTTETQRIELSPIDVMEFTDQGRIHRMRAFWTPEDIAVS